MRKGLKMKDPCERENDQIASADGRVSYTVFLDESGSKQKAQTPPQDVDDVGVAVGLILRSSDVAAFKSEIHKMTGVELTGESHITDLGSEGQEAIRSAVHKVMTAFKGSVRIVYDAISAAGYHNAEYSFPHKIKSEIERERVNKSIRITTHEPNPSAHAEMLAGAIEKSLATIVDIEQGASDIIDVQILTDKMDGAILDECSQNISDLLSLEHSENVRAFDTVNKRKLNGTVASNVSLPPLKLPRYEIVRMPKTDYGVFAADIVANEICHHLKVKMKNGETRLNSCMAINDFELGQLIEASEPDSSDVIYNRRKGKMKVVFCNITELAVDAIVNAANQVMLGGGGVDGAIHRAAGRELYEACLKVPEVRPGVRCPTGDARITPGFKLPAKFVIHTVGPVYRDGQHGEPEKLAGCYRNSLAVAIENGCRSVAFPCISTGVYGYPIRDAAEIAVREVKAVLAVHPDLEVTFCCFSAEDKAVYDSFVRP